jgi:hypothetical protein
MEYIISNDGRGATDVAFAEWGQAGGQADQHDSLGGRESLVARANRLYVMGEMALAARLLIDANASSYGMDASK